MNKLQLIEALKHLQKLHESMNYTNEKIISGILAVFKDYGQKIDGEEFKSFNDVQISLWIGKQVFELSKE